MEKIYDPESFRASEHIQTKAYFKRYGEICCFTHQNSETENLNNIVAEMNLSENINIEELRDTCSIKNFRYGNKSKNVPLEIPQKLSTKSKLETVYQINDVARRLNVIKCKEALEKKIKIQLSAKRFLKTVIGSNSSPSAINDISPGTNFIYSILIYRPFSISYGQRNSAEKLRFAYQIEALGTNTLAEVADKIECISDTGLFKEVENTKAEIMSFIGGAKKHYPSQTIFIDGVFYNDLRSPYSIDYSQTICKWAMDKLIGKFTTARMEEILLETLTPRFGYPYVYIHHGNCEHILTFSDARLIQPNDCLTSKKYPQIVSLTRPSHVLCFICSIAQARWLVARCDKFPQEKVFLCTECCDSYLYVDGEKIGSFQLYPYYEQIRCESKSGQEPEPNQKS